MKNLIQSSLLLLALGLAGVTSAQTPHLDLTVGDRAPKLQVGKWVQGEPVQDFDSNHVYVVEFWATWCGPCRASIPHLNELAGRFKDKGVIVIGQDVWDEDGSVAAFVKQMGEKMSYRVVLDDKSGDPQGFMAAHWWKRGVNHHGIPNAFIITRDRRIAWIGHPMGLTEARLNDVLSEQFDLAKAAAEYKKEVQENERFQELNDKLATALKQERWDAAAQALDDITHVLPEARREGYGRGARQRILLGQKRYDEAYRLADAFSDAHPTDYQQQNAFAWTILTQKEIDPRNLALAQKLAERANHASGGEVAGILDTLARAQFMLGRTNEAVATEERAASHAEGGERAEVEATLASYKAGKLPDVKE